ncbi:response regulator transcription factor [Cohnella terricola]|uniref:Response regulator transcription factor n=1 Tax=Cohnella terricola TaxID=1289167 RepID=A0A559JQB2_9BACL|nr:response regulator transcription factor [Cohnella terricola]TVY02048.1 response regulator transcription factor [Cohnella terricola]
MRILVIEDDLALLGIIRDLFESENFITDGATTGDDGLFLAEQAIYDLIVLDIMLPGVDGIEIVRRLRAQSNDVPIILLTARGSLDDRVNGLDAGADDYVPKPFALAELLARARAVLRRKGMMSTEGDISCGPVRLVPTARDAYIGDKPLKLTLKEYELLEFLLCNQDRILTREQIFDRIWGFDSEAAMSAVDVYVHLLRKKLSAHAVDNLIQTVRGTGYMIKGGTYVS